MAISNEEAMRELQDMKIRADAEHATNYPYWYGVFIGASGAYMLADVITTKQFIEITRNELATT